jgi:hypothetical protein
MDPPDMMHYHLAPPSSPTHRRSKSRCIERSRTLGCRLIGIGSPAPGNSSSGSFSASSTSGITRRSLPKRPALPCLQTSNGTGHPARTVSSTAALPPSVRPSTGAAANAPPTRAFSTYIPKQPLLSINIIADGSDDCEADDNDASSDFELSMDSFGHEVSIALSSHNVNGKYGIALHVNVNLPAQRAQMAHRENIACLGNHHSAQARVSKGASPGPSPTARTPRHTPPTAQFDAPQIHRCLRFSGKLRSQCPLRALAVATLRGHGPQLQLCMRRGSGSSHSPLSSSTFSSLTTYTTVPLRP